MNKYRYKECRLEHGYNQREIANKLHVARSTYTCYEQGLRDMPSELLIKLADIYNCTIDELLGTRYYYEVIAIEADNNDN